MNVERILHLADVVETQPHTSRSADAGFSMESINHDCGTPACLAGWAAWEKLGRPEQIKVDGAFFVARDYLGLSTIQADSLFLPMDWQENDFTPAQAARTLRHLAATGEVRWDLPAEQEA